VAPRRITDSKDSPRLLSCGKLLEVGDQVAAFVGLPYSKLHVIAGDQGVGIGEPSFQRIIVPGDVCFL